MLAEARSYFHSLSKLGITEHLGSVRATQRLVDLCYIGSGQVVLDVGCGVGVTPCYLAKQTGCQVVGVDLLAGMVAQSRIRAKEEGVADRVVFQVADARALPFGDGSFDAVIVESVNVFFRDRGNAIGEYVRVTKSGGYVGLTEMTWLRPPSPEAVAFYRRVFFAETLQAGGWVNLLEKAGLDQIAGHVRHTEILVETRGQFERYGFRGIAQVAFRMLVALLRDRRSRASVGNAAWKLVNGMLKDLGYGVYAGRKPVARVG